LLQSVLKSADARLRVQVVCVQTSSEHANSSHSFALLRERNERPSSNRAANQTDEFPPPH
jgi:hypothetical protein